MSSQAEEEVFWKMQLTLFIIWRTIMRKEVIMFVWSTRKARATVQLVLFVLCSWSVPMSGLHSKSWFTRHILSKIGSAYLWRNCNKYNKVVSEDFILTTNGNEVFNSVLLLRNVHIAHNASRKKQHDTKMSEWCSICRNFCSFQTVENVF